MRTIEAMQRQLLGLIGRAVVKSISAATKCQTVDVSLIAGEPKAGIEHLEPYGFYRKGKQRCGSGGVVSGWRPFSCGGCYGVGPALPPERAADG